MALVEVWERVEAWLAAHAPDVLASLQPPAKPDEIAALEGTVGIALPPDFKASLARHNGQRDDAMSGLFPHSGPLGAEPAWQFVSTAASITKWKILTKLLDGGEFEGTTPEPAPGVQAAWWHRGWIPIAEDGGGDLVCLDMSPAQGGLVGQVILHQHDGRKRPVLAASLEVWMTDLARGMETGRYTYDEDEQNLVEV